MVNLKQRIIGAFVLLALAVIFLPVFLQRNPRHNLSMEILNQQPVAPKIEFVAPDTLKKETEAQVVALTPTPKEVTQSVPARKAWVVQVGTFSQAGNAKKLVEELQENGYAAYARTSSQDNKTFVRVFIGPLVRQEKADAIQKALASQFQLKGQVLAYIVDTQPNSSGD